MTRESPSEWSVGQTLKCRDDQSPVRFLKSGDETPTRVSQFKLDGTEKLPWMGEEEQFGTKELRSRIEPWLTALFQSEHFSLLTGSGLTQALQCISDGEPHKTMDPVKFSSFNDEINEAVKTSACAVGRSRGNIEDQIRIANELLRGLKIRSATKLDDSSEHKEVLELSCSLRTVLADLTNSILEGEYKVLRGRLGKSEEAFSYLVNFLMSFASRTGTRDRLQIFTTNYDRCIEAGADLAGLRLIDRFVGTLAPVFRASRLDIDLHYNPPGIRGEPRYLEGVARFAKLHGSVDWVDCDRSIRRLGLPFGARDTDPFLTSAGICGTDESHLMIYPNAAKDRETASYPYVELFRDFAAAICRPNNTLICYGYGFGDEHINRVIEDMLTIPSTHLVIIAFGDPLGRIKATYCSLSRTAQITLMIGDHLGDLRNLVDYYLPKPAIDRTTIRMAELLKDRWGADQGRINAQENVTLDKKEPNP